MSFHFFISKKIVFNDMFYIIQDWNIIFYFDLYGNENHVVVKLI